MLSQEYKENVISSAIAPTDHFNRNMETYKIDEKYTS